MNSFTVELTDFFECDEPKLLLLLVLPPKRYFKTAIVGVQIGAP